MFLRNILIKIRLKAEPYTYIKYIWFSLFYISQVIIINKRI